MKAKDKPTKEQVNEAVHILTRGVFFATDLIPIMRNIYQFIAETKLQYEDECFGSPQDAAQYLFALRVMSDTIEAAQ
jgi:hypothetical protein